MNDASDISSLYQRFGGDADQYLELGQANHAQASRERWPLLSAIRPELAMVPPAVGERVEVTHAVSPWASAAPVAAPPSPPPLAAAVRVEPWLAPPVVAAQPEPPAPSSAVTLAPAADAFATAPHLPVPSVPAAPSAPAATPAQAAVPAAPVTPAPAAAPAAPSAPSAEPRPSLQNVFARLAQSGSSSSKP